ncbi:MAG TPA: hypothetical protein VGD79_12485, partial [Thermoanaerobaculia bacterium]
MRELTFSLTSEGKRWPAATAIELANSTTAWQWSVAVGDVRKKQSIHLLPGEYQLTVTAPGHERLSREVKVTSGNPRVDLGMLLMAVS